MRPLKTRLIKYTHKTEISHQNVGIILISIFAQKKETVSIIPK